MPIPVGIHPAALGESLAAERWYRARSDAAAAGFVAEVDRAVGLIGEAPERWPQHTRGTRRFFLRRYPFTIVFRTRASGVEIVAVAHARRRPECDLNRAADALAIAGIRQRFPGAADREVFLRLAVRKLGSDLARRSYPELAEIEHLRA